MRAAAGFTLIEMLVAVALLALLGTLGWRGLDAVRQSGEHLGRSGERWQGVALFGERLGRDLRQSLPGDWQARGSADAVELRFTRSANEDGAPVRLAYRWQAQRLSLRQGPSDASFGQAVEQPLLEDVSSFAAYFLDARGQWREGWPDSAGATQPRAVRIVMDLPDLGRIERVFDVPAAD